MTTSKLLKPAGLFRRLFAIFYDCFLLLAILFIVSAVGTTLNNGQAIEPSNAFYPFFVLIIFTLSYLYFAWFWIHGGQTLGMKTWKIQLKHCDFKHADNSDINWKVAAIRFLGATISWAVFGLGFLRALFNKDKRCWHDSLSKTFIVDLREQE